MLGSVRFWLSFTVLILSTLACSLPVGETAPMATATLEVSQPLVTQTPAPETATAEPTAGSGDAQPSFSAEILFAPLADRAAAQRYFEPAVEEVFAIWDYANMREGLIIRREWYLDGVLWLEREEPWDFTRYGESGTVTDVSVFDRDAGLPSGNYELRLYIDGVAQFDENVNARSFVVSPRNAAAPRRSPDGQLTARVEGVGALVIDGPGSASKHLLEVAEIEGLAWFPDSKHLVFTEVDRSSIQFGTVGIKYTLWVVDVQTGQKWAIANPEDVYFHPSVAPDGRTVAVLQGSGYGDACGVDLDIAFIRLGADLRAIDTVTADEFANLPPENDGSRYPFDQDGVPLPGVWESATRFQVGLSWACASEPDPAGIYRLDLNTLTATKIGELVRNEG